MSFLDQWSAQEAATNSPRGPITSTHNKRHELNSQPSKIPFAGSVGNGSDTVKSLSAEEVALWTRVRDSSISSSVGLIHNQTVDIPSSDEEFRSAIKALRASTHAIERQTRTINSQAAYLMKLRANDDAANHRRTTHAHYLGQREAAEIQHVTFANEQLLSYLRADLQSESENVAKDVKSVHSVVSQVLSADDRAMAELNDLTTRRTISTVDTSDAAQRLARLTSALQHFRVQAVKDRLDSTYLQRLNDLSSLEVEGSPQDPAVPSATVQEIQHDLGSLYSEIDDVVTMTVRHEHTGPIEATLHQIDAAREMEGKAVGRQIHGRLSSLTESLDQLSSTLENLHIQRTTLRDLLLKSESLQHHQRPQQKPPPRPHVRPTPPAGAGLDTATINTTAHPALSTLLHHLSLSAHHDHSTSSNLPLHMDIQTQTTKLQNRSADHVAGILTASENAATNRREILDAVTSYLISEVSEKNEQTVGDLEAAVNAARLQMESRA